MSNPGVPLQKNDPIKETYDFFGITIDIEWPKGSIREYKGSDFRKEMIVNYGYIRSTDSVDGEELDVYFKDDNLSDKHKIYKITQLRPKKYQDKLNTWCFDEYKYMLGFSSSSEAINAYVRSMTYDHFGGISPMSLSSFRGVVTRNMRKVGLKLDETSIRKEEV